MEALKSNSTKAMTAALTTSAMLMIIACARPPEVTTAEGLTLVDSAEIVGGSQVESTDQISTSTVVVYDASKGGLCTGTLISKNLVLTAAHCTNEDARNLAVGFGLALDGKSLKFSKVVAGVAHTNWATQSEDGPDGDIAVLRIEGSLPAGYAPATILSKKANLKNGMTVTLAGYGNLSMKPKISAERMMKTEVLLTNKDYSPTELEFAQYEGRGACHGDSGGPAFVKNASGKLVLIGVTSRSTTESGGRTCLEGSIYTSTSAHLGFIQQAAVDLNKANPPFVIPQPEGL